MFGLPKPDYLILIGGFRRDGNVCRRSGRCGLYALDVKVSRKYQRDHRKRRNYRADKENIFVRDIFHTRISSYLQTAHTYDRGGDKRAEYHGYQHEKQYSHAFELTFAVGGVQRFCPDRGGLQYNYVTDADEEHAQHEFEVRSLERARGIDVFGVYRKEYPQ